jgi:hypothetical protein
MVRAGGGDTRGAAKWRNTSFCGKIASFLPRGPHQGSLYTNIPNSPPNQFLFSFFFPH